MKVIISIDIASFNQGLACNIASSPCVVRLEDFVKVLCLPLLCILPRMYQGLNRIEKIVWIGVCVQEPGDLS